MKDSVATLAGMSCDKTRKRSLLTGWVQTAQEVITGFFNSGEQKGVKTTDNIFTVILLIAFR